MIKTKASIKIVLIYILFPPYENHYITDWGNGVIIKGDRYVKSGEWVYDCARWHLVSKIPRPFPAKHFMKSEHIQIDYYQPIAKNENTAKAFINQTLNTESWHESLNYVDTYINESSQIYSHRFKLRSAYKGEQWVLTVRQLDNLDFKKPYSISAIPYDARYQKPHAQLVQEAKASCPKPQ